MMFLEPLKESKNMITHYQQCFCCTEIQKYMYLEKIINKIIFGACIALLTPSICTFFFLKLTTALLESEEGRE